MTLLETFICSLEVEPGVILEPNANQANPSQPAETPFTVLFDPNNPKFTNDVGGDFSIFAKATNVLTTPYYIFTINGLPIGTPETQEDGFIKIRNGRLEGAPDGKIRTVVNGFNATADSFYEFLTSEEFCNIDPSSDQFLTVRVHVFDTRQFGHFNFFPLTSSYNSAISSATIRVRVSTDETSVLTGELTEPSLSIITERQITAEELSQLDLTTAAGFFQVRIGGEIITPSPTNEQLPYEIDTLVGVDATIDHNTGEFKITSLNELNENNQAGVVFEANHTVDVDGREVHMKIEREFIITVNSSYQDPGELPEDLGIPYDEIEENTSIPPYGICKFNYNFHTEKYESFISNDSVPHNLLPCYYNNTFFLNNKESENNFFIDSLKSTISLGDRIPLSETANLLIPATTKITQEQELSLERYYKKYGVTLFNNSRSEDLTTIDSKMSYKFIYDTEYREFLDNGEYEKVFPFYNTISFPKLKTGRYGKLLEKYKKCDDFKIINELLEEIPQKSVLFNGEERIKRIKHANLLGQEGDSLYANPDSYEIRDYMFYADPEETNMPVMEQQSYVETEQSSHQLLDKIIKNKVIEQENNFLEFQSDLNQGLYEGDIASIGGDSETLYYKIKKYQDNIGTEPITTICIPNVDGIPNITYIDTQIKANKDYHYVIDAIILCRSSHEDGGYFLLQQEVTSIHNVTLNNPPMPIDYNIFPYLGEGKENNKVRIKMNQSVGEGHFEIISLDEEERTRAERIKVSQGIDSRERDFIFSKNGYENVYSPEQFEDNVYFKNDDPIKVYEIYRLDFPPTRVEDFTKAVVNRTVDSFYEDELKYNKNYYYMVRGIDSHGNVSNPSPILRVMIVDEGKRYSIIRPYDFDEHPEKKHNTTKKMRKFMRIRPLPASMTVVEQQGELKIGGESSEPWGKDYKIRVTSNTSGKMVDINFKFTRESSLNNETN